MPMDEMPRPRNTENGEYARRPGAPMVRDREVMQRGCERHCSTQCRKAPRPTSGEEPGGRRRGGSARGVDAGTRRR
jgi:hypothetical protein